MQQRHFSSAVSGLLIALFITLPAAAQVGETESPEREVRRYSVEIILFRYAPGTATGNERFLPETPDDMQHLDGTIPEFSDRPPGTSRSGERSNEAEQDGDLEPELALVDVGVRVTPRNALQLRAVYDKLTLLDAYQPVLWTGWTQDALEPEVTPEIPLHRLGNAPADFDGTLKLYSSRFLHLVANLTMTEPSLTPSQLPVQLKINEDRIMKNGDIRYYDHPRFGLLAKVMRLEEAEAATNDASSTPFSR